MIMKVENEIAKILVIKHKKKVADRNYVKLSYSKYYSSKRYLLFGYYKNNNIV